MGCSLTDALQEYEFDDEKELLDNHFKSFSSCCCDYYILPSSSSSSSYKREMKLNVLFTKTTSHVSQYIYEQEVVFLLTFAYCLLVVLRWTC